MVEVPFGDSVHDNRNWDKKCNNLTKKIRIWKKMQLSLSLSLSLSLRGKNNPKLNFWSKLWPVGKIYTITEYIWKTIDKRIYNFLLSKNNATSQAPNSPSHLKMWVMYFRHRYSMNLLKNWIDSTIVESYQCSQDRSHTILIRLGSYFQPWLCPF